MKVMSWNVRGGGGNKRRIVKELLILECPDIAILLETIHKNYYRQNFVQSLWA